MKKLKLVTFVVLALVVCATVPTAMAASTATVLTIKPPAAAYTTQPFDITGKLMGGPTSAGESDRQITVYQSTDGKKWTAVGTAKTDGNGYYTVSISQPTEATYYYKATFAGDKILKKATSPTITVAITRIPTTFTFKGLYYPFFDENAYLPFAILADDQGNGLGAKTVTLLYSTDGGITWNPVPSSNIFAGHNPFTTNGDPEAGWTVILLNTFEPGWQLKYSFAGDNIYAPSESNVVSEVTGPWG